MRLNVQISLTSIYVANAIGIALIVILLMGNLWRLRVHSAENKSLLAMLVLTLVTCFIDPLVFTADSKEGSLAWAVIFFGNTLLFLANMYIGFCWVYFLGKYLNGGISKAHFRTMLAILFVGTALVVANFPFRFIFDVSAENTYSRQAGYWIYIIITHFFMLDSLVLYCKSKSKGGILKFFPVWVYFFPILAGTLAQTLFYGISTISAGLAVSMAGIFSSLQNEVIFRDRLTSIYNRAYLDHLMEKCSHQKNAAVTGMMLDLNSFKKINDNFGHSVGDDALISVAKILRNSVNDLGTVIRYAGDEFIILLNTQNDILINKCIETIQSNLSKFNATSKKPYKLSISIGASKLDLQNHSVDEFINAIDGNMYENKKAFYASNAMADRRQR